MTQKEQAELITLDAKYEPSGNCTICGMPTRTASLKCWRCLEALYLQAELAYTGEWLKNHSDVQLELGHDQHKVIHLVLLRNNVRSVGWCGAKVTQTRAKRPWIRRGMFPPGICKQCFSIYDGMEL